MIREGQIALAAGNAVGSVAAGVAGNLPRPGARRLVPVGLAAQGTVARGAARLIHSGRAADLEFGARTTLLWWTGAGLLAGAILAAAAAGRLYAASRTRR